MDGLAPPTHEGACWACTVHLQSQAVLRWADSRLWTVWRRHTKRLDKTTPDDLLKEQVEVAFNLENCGKRWYVLEEN